MLSVDQARAQLLNAARPVTETETLATTDTLGRILAESVVSAVNVPPLDNSAMDGYAVRLAEAQAEAILPVSQRIPAGTLPQPLAMGSAARIFTGAPVPEGADAIVIQEDTEAADGQVRILRAAKPAAHIRRAGEDIRAGQTVLVAGTRLGPAQLGVAASTGADRLTVYRRLKVAVFFTGDELVQPGQPLPPGRIYNSNRASLIALLTAMGCEVIDLGTVTDTLAATTTALEQAAREADVVMTTGGVSVGEEDHVKAAVSQLGRLDLWKVAMKPGKPLAYGRVGTADFIGLPGNPVSAYVVFCLFAQPFLLTRMGGRWQPPLNFNLPAGFERKKAGDRQEYLRARVEQGRAVLYPNQSSGALTSMAWAEGLVEVEAGHSIATGDPVRFIPMVM
ncbi:MAG: molybdopterin molybdotransferase MoeA [Parasulfuritortus sp.]|nr:molybdopterin molybdotransferase MoeA [Parasulfuritortus sp.]